MTATLKDIAREVNRSVTTVSRALHDFEDVSPETRALVKRTALQMGYTPNVAAQRLQKQRADTIGLILPAFGPRLSDPHFADVLSAVTDTIAEAGFDLLISISDSEQKARELYNRKIKGRQLDSVLVVRTLCHDARIGFLQQYDMPFVVNGRTLDDLDFPFVDMDHQAGARILTQHLVELGHKRIAFATGSQNLAFVHFQIEGFQQTLAEYGLSTDESLVFEADLTQRGGYGAAHVLLSQEQPPTAILASSDLMALGIMSAAQDQGLVVGQDIAVAGFDDIPAAESSYPTLTTIRQPAAQAGRLLGQMLVDSAYGKPLHQAQVLLPPSLIIRQSTSLDLWL